MNIKTEILKIAKEAKKASYKLAMASTKDKNKALEKMADGLLKEKDAIIKVNKQDVANAKKKGLSSALIDRLTLNEERIEKMASDIRDIVKLEDPVGVIIKTWERPNGLKISKKRVPIGVIGIIYESRPNVTSDAATLCLKAGNAVILRGGSESFNSNKKIAEILRLSLKGTAIPEEAIQFIPTIDRKAVDELLKLNAHIDLIIPRGGEELIRKVTENSYIPVIKHYKGVCHVYVDRFANLKMAEDICFNAKVQRPSVCNAMETMLVDEKIAKEFLPSMFKKFKSAGVEIRGCAKTRKIVKGIKSANESDWYAEYLDLILAVKIIPGVDDAIEHINTYGTHLSDSIVTEDYSKSMKFLNEVDSACVYVNASTRFTDGGEFGLGAEIGISTDKIHARGPMGLEELTTYKYIV
ncbi:MAG: glutamate-5-semialdehyde dehydrogenase, partial [Candidatus Omnitrophica bacterium]|nr:glutamate-5-semialdehyde dehydrogenase [Candidatus Omnitrophota bacterium]